MIHPLWVPREALRKPWVSQSWVSPSGWQWCLQVVMHRHHRVPLSTSHWNALSRSPDKVQGLLLVYAPRVGPLPVQEVTFTRTAGVLRLIVEFALRSQKEEMSVTFLNL